MNLAHREPWSIGFDQKAANAVSVLGISCGSVLQLGPDHGHIGDGA
jgi:hypothetical protein